MVATVLPRDGTAVPAYAHPAVAPQAWRRLESAQLGAGFVIVNPGDGPGAFSDHVYVTATRTLREHGVALCGYVDSDYGRRPAAELLRDAAIFREWYGVTSVFVDQVSAEDSAVEYYRQIVDAVHDAGGALVALNPGVVPEPGIAVLGDVLVIFEGPWQAHMTARTPDWLRQLRPPNQLCHLVHSIPSRASVAKVLARAEAAGAGIVGITSDGMPNPWSMVGQWVV